MTVTVHQYLYLTIQCRCLVVPWLVAHLVQLVCLGWVVTLASLGLTLHLLLQVMTWYIVYTVYSEITLIQTRTPPLLCLGATLLPGLATIALLGVWLTVLAAYWSMAQPRQDTDNRKLGQSHIRKL